MDPEYFSHLLRERNEKFTSMMQAFGNLSTGEINSSTYDYLAILTPMIQQLGEQQTMMCQMIAERLSQREEDTSYGDEDDPFNPFDFSNIKGCPHELQYDVWEEHAPEFDNEQDPYKFYELFVDFIAKYNLIYEEEIMKMFALSIKRYIGYWY